MPNIWQWVTVHLISLPEELLTEAAINLKYGWIIDVKLTTTHLLIHPSSEVMGVIIMPCQFYFYIFKYSYMLGFLFIYINLKAIKCFLKSW